MPEGPRERVSEVNKRLQLRRRCLLGGDEKEKEEEEG
jgi:hypothetical protein